MALSTVLKNSAEYLRQSFSKIKLSSEYPDLLEIQLKSFQEFFQVDTTQDLRQNEELYRVFEENFPITDARNIFVLEFLDYLILFSSVILGGGLAFYFQKNNEKLLQLVLSLCCSRNQRPVCPCSSGFRQLDGSLILRYLPHLCFRHGGSSS